MKPFPEDRNLSENKIKVIDRRMFTADGELREAYQGTIDPDAHSAPRSQPSTPAESTATDAAVASTGEPAPAAPTTAVASEPPARTADDDASPAPAQEAVAEEDDAEGPRFTDLVAFMAQTAAAYLQQARATALGGSAAPGSSSEMLQMARLHVDLLSVLERKTTGNLTAEEREMLLDVQRQLRIALQ